ncbi:hypothetical protein GCM10010387_15440 [Streptomyces inusitatus]|uniref:Uncharacterized protein n=1 Tax=Streptomyces inusitatus TaxID=68221 RepID=A0A918PWC4_9ACTN|nr:hypothetical protein [Streptomyces inusitatus]GGZ23241.1 hypothetical protein GCM10010387_15440 [Streptomyces inusitatus]
MPDQPPQSDPPELLLELEVSQLDELPPLEGDGLAEDQPVDPESM